MLESSVASPAKARLYGELFFKSRPVMVFLLSRLYAW
jgi:hypothetical protein